MGESVLLYQLRIKQYDYFRTSEKHYVYIAGNLITAMVVGGAAVRRRQSQNCSGITEAVRMKYWLAEPTTMAAPFPPP